MICVDHLCYHYKGGRPILRDVSFELEDGRFLAVLVLIGYCYLHRWDYNALLSGEETAMSLGIHVRRLTLTNVVLTCLVCSVIVSHVGLIKIGRAHV